MRVAIIGQSGQLARALIHQCKKNKIAATSYGRNDLDLSADINDIEGFIDNIDTDAVIIAAAYTAVDAAQDDYDTALAVNALAPAAIARACSRRDIALVHVSTDYVFKGDAKSPYKIGATTDPINAYGSTKLMGEKGVLEAHDRAAILRTSWVFDGHGKNFMTTMLSLAQTREQLNIVGDQIGRPTYAGHLAQACLSIAKALLEDKSEETRGIYHISGAGKPISWAEFAKAIFAGAQTHLPHAIIVTPIPSEDYPTPAPRPAYSVLDLDRYESRLGALPPWRDGLEDALKEWTDNSIWSPTSL